MNYPDIKWETYTNSSNKEDKEFMFKESIKVSFLYQLIKKPSRARGSNKPSVLDLVLTHDGNTIKTVTYDAPLGKSDHTLIKIEFTHKPGTKHKSGKKRNYEKGDFDSMRRC